MSYKAVEQALGSLLPSLADELPDELLKLAAHLLAQSRSYARSLKPEEEIARPYVCAAIACKRLTKQLKLPATVGRPPCPPRIYKKLSTYLEQSLSKAPAPSKRQIPDRPSHPATKKVKGAEATTPSKSPAKRTPVRGPFSGNAQTKSKGSVRSKDAPSWTMPLIRQICKAIATPAPGRKHLPSPATSKSFPPHLYAGLSSILPHIPALREIGDHNEPHPDADFLSKLTQANSEADKEYRERMITLIIALYFLVFRQSYRNRTVEVDAFVDMSNAALATVGLAEDFHHDVDKWIAIIVPSGLIEDQDWFRNIPDLSQEEKQNGTTSHGRNEDEDDYEIVTPKKRRMMNRKDAKASKETDSGSLLLPGLGTMMSDRVDWLSDERRADYMKWKADILKTVRVIEAKA